MPCYQTNELVYAKLDIRKPIFKKMIPFLQEELGSLDWDAIFIDGTLTIGNYVLNTKTGQAKFPQGMETIHNAVKRAYSMAVVQSVAAKSQVFRAFKTKKVDSRNVVMARR
jgi:hypothetical protein